MLNIHVENELVMPQSEVQLKIDNLNIEDIFDKHRIQRLMEIFKQRYLKPFFVVDEINLNLLI